MNCRKSKKFKTIGCLINIVAYTSKGANSSVVVGKDVNILLLASSSNSCYKPDEYSYNTIFTLQISIWFQLLS
jgi:hypothetical protein